MLDDVERERPCFLPSPAQDPAVTAMPTRQMPNQHKGEKHILSKKPLHNSVNNKSKADVPPQELKIAGRRRGRGKPTARQAKLETEAAFESASPPVSSKGIAFCRRPGFGQEGTRCIVKANHFLTELPDKDLSQYDVRMHFHREATC